MRAQPASLLLRFTLAIVAACTAGSTGVALAQAMAESGDLSAVGAPLSVARFRHEPESAQALSTRATGIAAVLSGSEIPGTAAGEVSRALKVTPGQTDLLMESAAGIRIHIDAPQSELLAVHGAVADDFTSDTDIGAARARNAFDDAMKVLVSRQLVDSQGLAMDRVRTGRLMQSETPRGGKPTSRIKEYLFEVPRVVGGVEVFGASVNIAVHRSGRIASIRTLGPLVSMSGDDETFKRTVSTGALTERARRDNPGAEVIPIGLRYPWKATQGKGQRALRPHETFRVNPVTTVEERQINGRSHFVFYAVDNAKASPIVWPRPNPTATGDPRKQQKRPSRLEKSD